MQNKKLIPKYLTILLVILLIYPTTISAENSTPLYKTGLDNHLKVVEQQPLNIESVAEDFESFRSNYVRVKKGSTIQSQNHSQNKINQRGILVKMKQGESFPVEKFYDVKIMDVPENIKEQNIYLIRISEESNYNKQLEDLRNETDILYAEPDSIYETSFTPSDPHYNEQWYLNKIEMDKAWDINKGSSDVKIAILDTGVNANHPDLAGRVLPGYDFVNDDNDPSDDNGHGTHIAGIIASNIDNIGIAGIDLNANILPVKVGRKDGAVSSLNAIEGIYYAIDNGADVINMSYGGYQYSEAINQAIQEAYSEGIVLVAAAGNEASSEWSYPASYGPVISVAATDENDSPTDFTNYGEFIDITAPGQNIYSTNYVGGYSTMNGTSFSAPIVSALAGLIKSQHPEWTPEKIEWALQLGADQLGTADWNSFTGFGRVNGFGALTANLPSLLNDQPDNYVDANQINSGQVYQDKIDLPMDVDWYAVEVTQNSELSVSLTNPSSQLDLIGIVYKEDETTVIERQLIDDYGMGANESMSIYVEPGTYYLAVYDYFNHWSKESYEIQMNIEKTQLADSAAPVASLGSGVYLEPIEVALTSDSGSAIYYTLDGTDPSHTSGELYTNPIKLDKNTILKAVTIESYITSEIVTYNYTIATDSIFTDTVGHWAERNITYLYYQNVITGYSNGTFLPNDKITRAEATTIIIRELGLPLENSNFVDVSNNYWASKYIGAAVNAKIINGYDGNKFKPNDYLTRAEMAAILVRAYKLTGNSDISFPDVSGNYWAHDYIENLLANKITNGYSDGNFGPKDNIKRAEFATMIARVLGFGI
ncbi:S8 family serine peptidase [Aquibacillus rhizosphaerae]|uniref:S8 family serine peptidase n=1 Tax=Aquibacillus rhizosphaerae TaxID=3051431 RepID=A0ABT7L189_9BACI|nr:S8 family serine peptidase [Aquibacillus sp. LR5S19]MDL4838895.1 S8 family serine peptidase [Aquibacillus sp. LR5S19]